MKTSPKKFGVINFGAICLNKIHKSSIFCCQDLILQWHDSLETDENILTPCTNLTRTIQNKILNCRDTNQVTFAMTYGERPFKNNTLILLEAGIYNGHSSTCGLSNKRFCDVISNNLQLFKHVGLKTPEEYKPLTFLYWLPKLHYALFTASFIITTSPCTTKLVSKDVSKRPKKFWIKSVPFTRRATLIETSMSFR